MVTPAPHPWYYKVACALLLVALLLLGSHDTAVLNYLTAVWYRISAALPAALSQPVDGAITKRVVPVVVAYTGLYVGLCLLTFWFLLGQWRRYRFVLAVYAGSLVLCIGLLALGKLTHNQLGLYRLGRNLIDAVVSPLPLIVLAPLLYWYYPTPSVTNQPPLPGGSSVS